MSDDHAADVDARITAPQQEYTLSQVGTGLAVLAVGLAIAYALPLLLA